MALQVYIVQAGTDGPIKIGYSDNAQNRLTKMQTDCPYPIRVLALIDAKPSTEREFHERFAAYRTQGEWFAPCKEILEFAAKLSAPRPLKPRRRRKGDSHPIGAWLIKSRITRESLCEQVQALGHRLKMEYLNQILIGWTSPHWKIADAIEQISHGAVTAREILSQEYRRNAKRIAATPHPAH